MQLALHHLLSEVGQILQGLLRVQQTHVLHSEGLIAKGHALPIESVLESKNEALEALGNEEGPLAGCGYS